MNSDSLCFIDTNIWLYAFIPSQDPDKSATAKTIIRQSEIAISSQVINELSINLIRKASFDEPQLHQLISSFYSKYTIVIIDREILQKASELRHRLQFSFWDSLIVSSALIGGAEILYTEDMTDGLVVEGALKLVNPFSV